MEQYISKTALVLEIEKEIKKYSTINVGDSGELEAMYGAKCHALMSVLTFIDTLEVEEVDFQKEYIEEVYSHLDGIKDTADRMTSGNFMHHKAAIKFSANTIAKVLELIGLKALKGE